MRVNSAYRKKSIAHLNEERKKLKKIFSDVSCTCFDNSANLHNIYENPILSTISIFFGKTVLFKVGDKLSNIFKYLSIP